MLLNIIIIFLAVISLVVLLRKRINLGFVMILESIFLLILVRMPAADFFLAVLKTAGSYSTIKLVIIFIFIMMMENIMRSSNMIGDMVSSLKKMIGNNRIAAGLMPIIIGLLPSPGGARFSCPMVEEVAAGNSKNENLTFVNYWFRHVWMDGFFLYPGIILASELLGVNVFSFFIRLLPFMAFSAFVGYFTGLRKIKKEDAVRTYKTRGELIVFLKSMSPIIVVIVIYMALNRIFAYSLETALGIVTIALLIIKKYNFKRFISLLKEAFPYKLIFILLGVMIFKEILFMTGLLEGFPALMEDRGIPVYIIFILLPFLTGLLSGIVVSFVSLSFPILISIGLTQDPWYGILAFAAGYIGMMITPIHLCMVVSSEYFKHSVTDVVKKVALAELPMFIAISTIMILLFS